MQSESGMVRARRRKVLTENHFRAAEQNRNCEVSADGYSSVIRNAYDSMLY